MAALLPGLQATIYATPFPRCASGPATSLLDFSVHLATQKEAWRLQPASRVWTMKITASSAVEVFFLEKHMNLGKKERMNTCQASGQRKHTDKGRAWSTLTKHPWRATAKTTWWLRRWKIFSQGNILRVGAEMTEIPTQEDAISLTRYKSATDQKNLNSCWMKLENKRTMNYENLTSEVCGQENGLIMLMVQANLLCWKYEDPAWADRYIVKVTYQHYGDLLIDGSSPLGTSGPLATRLREKIDSSS